jgi:hypothetical protein
MVEDRKREGRSFAGPGLGNAHDIAASQNVRNGLCLNRRRDLILFVGQGTGDRLGQSKVKKSGQNFILSCSTIARPKGHERDARGSKDIPRGQGCRLDQGERRAENQRVKIMVFVHAARERLRPTRIWIIWTVYLFDSRRRPDRASELTMVANVTIIGIV